MFENLFYNEIWIINYYPLNLRNEIKRFPAMTHIVVSLIGGQAFPIYAHIAHTKPPD